MTVRQARPKDAEAICDLALRLVVPRTAPDSLSGLVEYEVPSVDNMKERIRYNPFFYVDEVEGATIGFLAAYSDSHMQRFAFGEGDIAHYILTKPAPFVYVDLLGVAPEFQHQGRGIHLINTGLKKGIDAGYKTFFAAPVHKPKRSIASIKLIEHFGLVYNEEVAIPNGLTFGIYRKSIA